MAKRSAELLGLDDMPVAKQPRIDVGEILVDWLQLAPDCWRIIITGLTWRDRLLCVLPLCGVMRDYVFPMRDVDFTREDAARYDPSIGYDPDFIFANCIRLFKHGIRRFCLLPTFTDHMADQPCWQANIDMLEWLGHTRQSLKQLTVAPTLVRPLEFPTVEELIVDQTLSGVTPYRAFWSMLPAMFPQLRALTFVHDRYRLPSGLLSKLTNLTSLTIHRNHFEPFHGAEVSVTHADLTALRSLSLIGTEPGSLAFHDWATSLDLWSKLRPLPVLERLEVDSSDISIWWVTHCLPSLSYLRWRDLKHGRLYQIEHNPLTDKKLLDHHLVNKRLCHQFVDDHRRSPLPES